jgi:hypothetical protein
MKRRIGPPDLGVTLCKSVDPLKNARASEQAAGQLFEKRSPGPLPAGGKFPAIAPNRQPQLFEVLRTVSLTSFASPGARFHQASIVQIDANLRLNAELEK